MKKEPIPKNYYDEYLEVCNSIPNSCGLPEMWKLLKKGNSGTGLNLPFGSCLIDYSTGQYNYMSENCHHIISYSKDQYSASGLDEHVIHFHPDDLKIFYEQVFRDIQEFWKCIPASDINQYMFSFNQRHLRNDDSTIQLLQQCRFFEPQYIGMPAMNLTVFSDITDFKSDDNMILSISRYVNGKGYVKNFSKTYPQLVKMVLSSRESEIIRLSLLGLTSKMIADKLFISMHTVKNHKRNMMEKTSTRNISELIHLSIKNSWI